MSASEAVLENVVAALRKRINNARADEYATQQEVDVLAAADKVLAAPTPDLLGFATEVIRAACSEGTSCDGGDVQEFATRYAILVPCGSDCELFEQDIGGCECEERGTGYRFAPSLRAAGGRT